MTHQQYLEEPYEQQAHDDIMDDHQWNLNYTEYLDHYGWDEVHPAIEAKYRYHFDTHLGGNNLKTFEAWLDDYTVSDVIEWINEYNKQRGTI